MNIALAPGKYVVAVSGGVDSMVLLDVLSWLKDLQLVVAHYDHGIRQDSHEDRKLVQQVAKRHGLDFRYEEGKMGARTSESDARNARYDFLERVKTEVGAQAIVTAHQQDDVVETLILNLIRGTGRRGLSSLRSTAEKVRPLLDCTKSELLEYAVEKGIAWREDSTNHDLHYKRNYVRYKIVPLLSPAQRQKLLKISREMLSLNEEIDSAVDQVLRAVTAGPQNLVRKKFIMLPHGIAKEVMAEYLRRCNVRNLSRRLIDRMVAAVKTARPHSLYDVDRAWILEISTTEARVKSRPPAYPSKKKVNSV